MEQPRVERVLRLMSMMTSSVNYTVDELAEKLDTTYRSIYRYFDTLKSVGFAIEKVERNIYKLVSMPKEFKSLQNVVFFSDEEAHIVCNLIEGVDSTNTLKAALYRKLAAIYDVTKIHEFEGSKSNTNNIAQIGKAMESKHKVILRKYSSANSGEIRDRIVEPFAYTNNHIDIWAYDCEKKANRLFKIPRIGKAVIMDEPWEFEDKHKRSAIDAFHMSGEAVIPVYLELSLRAKNLLCEEFPLSEADIELVDGTWVYKANVCQVNGVGRFVMGLLNEIRIIDSPALQDYVNKQLDNYLKR